MTDHDAAEPMDPEEAERLALEAAVAEARESGPGIPHSVMRKRLLEMIAEAQASIAKQARDANRG